mmetsp:Transcript_42686/g.117796  ORF Transcript_42686/g.117796 Transcript_42686/m.117796 type:complete len:202 (+) Transcript_42686:200-805(+)
MSRSICKCCGSFKRDAVIVSALKASHSLAPASFVGACETESQASMSSSTSRIRLVLLLLAASFSAAAAAAAAARRRALGPGTDLLRARSNGPTPPPRTAAAARTAEPTASRICRSSSDRGCHEGPGVPAAHKGAFGGLPRPFWRATARRACCCWRNTGGAPAPPPPLSSGKDAEADILDKPMDASGTTGRMPLRRGPSRLR